MAEIVQLLKPETTQAFLMTGGPCTVGPGKMASLEISQYLRRDEDIRESPDIKQMEEEAQRFYQQIQMSLLMLNCSLNLISYSLDQIGLYEMRDIFLKQSSALVSNEEFK